MEVFAVIMCAGGQLKGLHPGSSGGRPTWLDLEAGDSECRFQWTGSRLWSTAEMFRVSESTDRIEIGKGITNETSSTNLELVSRRSVYYSPHYDDLLIHLFYTSYRGRCGEDSKTQRMSWI